MKRILLSLALLGAVTAQAKFNFGVFTPEQVAKANAELAALSAPLVQAPVAPVVTQVASGYDYAALFASAQEKATTFGKELMNSDDVYVVAVRDSLAIAAVVTALYGSYRLYKYATTSRD